ncbi:MAG: hypothetical protein ACI9YT_002166, partial [Halobacteriales archaeon]
SVADASAGEGSGCYWIIKWAVRLGRGRESSPVLPLTSARNDESAEERSVAPPEPLIHGGPDVEP